MRGQSGRASFFFFSHAKLSNLQSNSRGKQGDGFTENKSIQSAERRHFHCGPKFVLARIYYLYFLFATVSTRQSTVPTGPLCAGLREAPGERKGLSLQDWGGTGREAAGGGGLQALQWGDRRQVNTRIHPDANIQGGTTTTWKKWRSNRPVWPPERLIRPNMKGIQSVTARVGGPCRNRLEPPAAG